MTSLGDRTEQPTTKGKRSIICIEPPRPLPRLPQELGFFIIVKRQHSTRRELKNWGTNRLDQGHERTTYEMISYPLSHIPAASQLMGGNRWYRDECPGLKWRYIPG